MTSPSLALHGGPKAVFTPRPPHARWGAEELARLTPMVAQSSLFYWKGPQCTALTEGFRRAYPLRHVMPCSSGSAALHIATAALRLPPGSEVITSPITDMGSVIGILYQQLVPVFADIHPHTYNLDPEDVRRRITPRTRALMVVHLAGNPSDMEALMAVARDHNLAVIEDCAQSWGARHRGTPVGLFGDLACYSFNEFKHVSCGDGGIVATNRDDLGTGLSKWGDKHYDRVSGGRDPQTLSPNYRMSEPQAAVAAAQMEKLPAIVAAHVRLSSLLLGRLRELAPPGIVLPEVDPRDTHSFWFLLLRLAAGAFRCPREEFVAALAAEGAVAHAGYIPKPVYRYPLFQNHDFFAGQWPLRDAGLTAMDYRTVSCPVAEAMLADSVSLPITPAMPEAVALETAAAIDKVARYYSQA
jgi:dTDP-4-amino-4,6-dideoxygalactose transaminase